MSMPNPFKLLNTLLAPVCTAPRIPLIEPVVSARKYTSALAAPACAGIVTVIVSSNVSPGFRVMTLVSGEIVGPAMSGLLRNERWAVLALGLLMGSMGDPCSSRYTDTAGLLPCLALTMR